MPDTPPNPYIMPVGAQPNNTAQWQARQAKLREWQAQNPSRAGRPALGLNVSNTPNYDASVYGSDYSGGPATPPGGYAGGYGPQRAVPLNTVERGRIAPQAMNGPGVGVNQPAPNTTATPSLNLLNPSGQMPRGQGLSNGRGPFRP